MTGRYAAGTDVTPDRSRAEVERTLARFGASAFSYGWQANAAAVQFVVDDRRIRFVLPMPDRNDPEFTRTPTGRVRSESAAFAEYEKAGRERWRALALVIKAKLAAVEAGIVTFEEEFLAHTVLPSGRTVAEEVGPQVAESYALGRVETLEIGR